MTDVLDGVIVCFVVSSQVIDTANGYRKVTVIRKTQVQALAILNNIIVIMRNVKTLRGHQYV
ncbi:hypothetical protein M993_01073 [Obesumbacterium proteus ATCC 12841]|uniref:Uncharacterized protein n=1 Tax=Obesumbacterium proteus ATCC 12841 TaxID=1354268 RepID=A0AA91IR65_9GAMM|nr:hypothetical protein M993_01073 [Obesumbacterium proteus ATCC 12841]